MQMLIRSQSRSVSEFKLSEQVHMIEGYILLHEDVCMCSFQIALIARHSPFGYVSDGLWCGIIVSTMSE